MKFLFMHILNTAKRQSLLKHGRIDIVQFLRDLPRTKHQSDLFEVDVIRAAVSWHSIGYSI